SLGRRVCDRRRLPRRPGLQKCDRRFSPFQSYIGGTLRDRRSRRVLAKESVMGNKYDYEIDVSDDSAPARVVRMVGREKRVLEIGAGPGSMSRVLRDKYQCHVTAVEIDDGVIGTLKDQCDRIYRVDLNDASWPQALA